MNEVGSKKGSLEFYRFYFCIIIFLVHFRGYGLFGNEPTAFYGGYLGVEFFFILSGFF